MLLCERLDDHVYHNSYCDQDIASKYLFPLFVLFDIGKGGRGGILPHWQDLGGHLIRLLKCSFGCVARHIWVNFPQRTGWQNLAAFRRGQKWS